MISNKRLQLAKYGYIVISVLFCILGIMLIVNPHFSISLLCRIGGTLMLVFGCVKITGYFSKDLYRLAFQFDLAFGILLIALGAVLILRTDALIHITCIFIGILILADGLLKIQIAIDSKAFGIRQWWIIFAVAVITGIIGFLLIFRPYASMNILMRLLGIALTAEGILNIVTILTAVNIIKKNRPLEAE